MRIYKKGQTTFEVVLALGLITLILTAVVSLASLSIVNSSYSKNQTVATRISESTLEWLRGQRDEDWSLFYDQSLPGGLGQTKCFTNLSWEDSKIGACGNEDYIPDTYLKREIDFSLANAETDTIETTVRIYWTDAKGYHEVNSSTYFTPWK